MANSNEPRDADFEQASSQLNQGLRTCRAVVESYRAILTGEQPANDDDRDDEVSRYGSIADDAGNAAGWQETA